MQAAVILWQFDLPAEKDVRQLLIPDIIHKYLNSTDVDPDSYIIHLK